MNASRKTMDVGLLLLRLGFGLSLSFGHGMDKLSKYMGHWQSGLPVEWADPIGLGAGISLLLAGLGEGLAPLLIAAGLCTRLASLGPLVVMSVAVVMVHAQDPWAKKEMAFLYLLAFLVIAIAGPGRFALDTLFCRKRGK